MPAFPIPRRRWLAPPMVLAAAMSGAGPAQAGGTGAPDPGWQPQVFLEAGSLGVGPELAVRLPGSPFGIRTGVHGIGFHDGDLADASFRHDEPAYGYAATLRLGGTVRLLNGGVSGDYYPLGRGLRLSAGIVIDGDAVSARGVPSGWMRIGPELASGGSPGSVRAGVTFNAVAPSLGAGWTGSLGGRWRWAADAGALFQGRPHLSFSMAGPMTALPAIRADAERERLRLHRLLDYPVLPMVMVGIGRSF